MVGGIDALVLADLYRGGETLGVSLGVANDLSVLGKVTAKSRPEGYLSLGRTADSYLGQQRPSGQPTDAAPAWFRLLDLLADRDLFKGWTWQGKDHRWPVAPRSRIFYVEKGYPCECGTYYI